MKKKHYRVQRPGSDCEGPMKYVVRTSFVDVVGQIWMPSATCSMRYTLSDYDIGNIRDREDPGITRRNIDLWLCCHAGDFQSIQDFSASIEDGAETLDFPWATEDGENAYLDTIAEDL